jgi:upstream activation factor subunit UAF30
MVRQVKPKSTETVSENIVQENIVPVPTINVKTEVKEKVVKAKKPKVEVSPAPVSSTPVVEVVVTDNVTTEVLVDSETNILDQSTELLAKLQQVGNLISSIKVEYRALEKKWQRQLKTAQKQSSKRKRKSGNRAPSGFVKPTRISDELAKFLDKPTSSEMARTEVTREINKYIRTNNLQDKVNGRKINPDSKLSSLLKLKKTDELTYFNLQRYMSPHFAKAIKDVVAEVPAVTM